MKKRKTVLMGLAAVLAFMLTGCVQADLHATINKNGSGDLDYKIGMDKTVLAMMSENGQNPIDEMKGSGEKNGFTAENYEDGDYVGVELKKHVDHAADISSSGLGDSGNIGNSIQVKDEKHFFYDIYKLDANMDLSSMTDSTSDTGFDGALLRAFMSKMDMKFRLTLPVKALKDNASKYDASTQTYEWKLVPGQENGISLQMKVVNVTHIVLTVVLAAVVILIAVLIPLFLRKKKKAAADPTITG